MRVALLALCACNQVYDLSTTQMRDAAPIDALPLACPQPPAVPQFGHALTQAFGGGCRYFNIDATGTVAMATCGLENRIGPPEGPLEPSNLLAGNALAPRPAPGGTRVYIQRNIGPSVSFEEFENVSIGTWKSIGFLPFSGMWMSNVARDGDGLEHVVVMISSTTLEEWVRKADVWGRERTITNTELETGFAFWPMISGDALRLVVKGEDETQASAMFYAARAKATDDFAPGARLADVPVPEYDDGAFLTNDCTRIYVSGLQQIFYLRQQ